MNRVLIGLHASTDWKQVQRSLRAIGVATEAPDPALPDVLVAECDTEADADALVERARAIAGVRYAERDAWRFTN